MQLAENENKQVQDLYRAGTRDIFLPAKIFVSEVGFEPTPTEVDCDLNAAP